jgi:hypothetical protein
MGVQQLLTDGLRQSTSSRVGLFATEALDSFVPSSLPSQREILSGKDQEGQERHARLQYKHKIDIVVGEYTLRAAGRLVRGE